MDLGRAHHQYLVLRPLHTWMREVAPDFVSGVLLDYGCGGQPYRELLEPLCDRYLGADVAAVPGVPLDHLLLPGLPVPLADASCDTVLSTQVLEHVPDPAHHLREARRLLRPGGFLVLTAPMQWRHHEAPRDYRRFTRYGLEHLLGEAGFEVLRVDPAGGAFAVAGQVLLGHLAEVRGLYWPWLMVVLNTCFEFLDGLSPDGDETLNWQVVARRGDPA